MFHHIIKKIQVITLFLALLELLKRQFIKVEQEQNYGEIEIYRNEDGEHFTE